MDPISAGLGIVGFGLQLFGNMKASEDAHRAAGIQKSIAGQEQEINAQKKIQMEMSAKREQLQIYRNMQRQRAMATAAAVNQGATFGSGLQGGLAGVTSGSEFNAQGVRNNLAIGENIFGINDKISGYKMQLSDVQSDMATDQGLASLGGSLVKSSGTIGQMSQSLFKGFGNA